MLNIYIYLCKSVIKRQNLRFHIKIPVWPVRRWCLCRGKRKKMYDGGHLSKIVYLERQYESKKSENFIYSQMGVLFPVLSVSESVHCSLRNACIAFKYGNFQAKFKNLQSPKLRIIFQGTKIVHNFNPEKFSF